MGYTGGSKEDPTYRDLGDHTEALQVDFDPEVVSYAELLDLFWSSHDPCSRSWSTQYKAAVFVHDEDQRQEAEETAARIAERRGKKVRTEILPAGRFTRAEDYHQKYRLRSNRALAVELLELYPDPDRFTDSTAAARLNGYLAGHGTAEAIRAELDDLGLSEDGRTQLEAVANRLDRRRR